mgnify:CR=1 FL=1
MPLDAEAARGDPLEVRLSALQLFIAFTTLGLTFFTTWEKLAVNLPSRCNGELSASSFTGGCLAALSSLAGNSPGWFKARPTARAAPQRTSGRRSISIRVAFIIASLGVEFVHII